MFLTKKKKYGRVKQGQVRSGQKVERHVSVVTTVSLLVPNPRRLLIAKDRFLDFFPFKIRFKTGDNFFQNPLPQLGIFLLAARLLQGRSFPFLAN